MQVPLVSVFPVCTCVCVHRSSLQQGQDGFAGFTVVGGRDQPQLPNAGAFIITSVNKGGPADGVLR